MDKRKKLLVTTAMPFSDVVKSQSDGVMLLWDPADFRTLSASELSKLSKQNQDAYQISRALAEEQQKQSGGDDLIAESFSIGKVGARATDRLHVKTTKAGVVTRWERPDMLEVRKSHGWRLAKGGHQTLSGDGQGKDDKGFHRIGSMGQEELLLIEIDEKDHRKLTQDKRRRRQRALTGINNDTKQQLRNLGSQAAGEVVDIVDDMDKETANTAFKAISPEGGN